MNWKNNWLSISKKRKSLKTIRNNFVEQERIIKMTDKLEWKFKKLRQEMVEMKQ